MTLSNLKIAYYRNLLLSMKVASYKGAPVIAKPVFMLTIIQMIEEGTLLGNKITFTDELCNTYSTLFQKYSTGKITPVIYPFYYSFLHFLVRKRIIIWQGKQVRKPEAYFCTLRIFDT